MILGLYRDALESHYGPGYIEIVKKRIRAVEQLARREETPPAPDPRRKLRKR